MPFQPLNEFYKEMQEKYAGEQPARGFRGIWIPKEIWLNSKLSTIEKVVLAEIWSLDNPPKGCTATNEYFMDFFGLKKTQLKAYLAKLIKLGFVSRGKFDGRRRTLHCNLAITKRKRGV